jgi:NAD(P)-dependent dehydrogenase (short-subunit alcohol dehydrogenase family)
MPKKLLITGAAGGMGRAAARLLSPSHDLMLDDVAKPSIGEFAKELERDGYTAAGLHVGNLGAGDP